MVERTVGCGSVLARSLALGSALCVVLSLLWAFAADESNGYSGIDSFTISVSSTQAGGHPDIGIDAKFDNRAYLNQELQKEPPAGCNCQDVEDFSIHFPTGFIGNPHSIPQCSLAEFALNTCSPDTQVGLVFLETPQPGNGDRGEFEEATGETLGFASPIYNLQPHPAEAGAVGSVAPIIEVPIVTSLSARTDSDYGLDATTRGIFHILPIPRLSLFLWGNPADHSHDLARFPLPHEGQGICFGTLRDQVIDLEDPIKPYGFGCHLATPSGASNLPYLQNPTACNVGLAAGLDLFYYDNTHLHADAPWPATTGCDQLTFNPSMTVKATTSQADTASGLDIDLRAPQTQNPAVPSASELHEVTVTLPKGFALTPNGADGKVACQDALLHFDSIDGAECPEFAKVGTLQLDSSALPGPIPGAIYIGEPLPGQTFRIFLVADGFATHVKVKGDAHLDPQTGQIVTTFRNLPQSPLQEFDMHFFGSERGIFATPTHCGNYAVRADFVPWDDALPSQTSVSSFTIDSGPGGAPCPGPARPFDPGFRAGTADNTAGVTTPLNFQIKRADGDQSLAGLELDLPTGLLQSIRGVSECPQSAIGLLSSGLHTGLEELALPSCPASSQIGTVTGGAGAGTHQIFTRGRVFLAGPYKGSPLSVLVSLPALGGPFDLGNIVTRAAIRVDPVTTQITAISDPIPQIVEGIPLRIRSILFNFDRPGFNFTPTNCDPKSIVTRLTGDEGAAVSRSAYYQVANCGDLPYGPKLSLTLKGGVRRRGHPAIEAVLETTPGEANNRFISVTLPKGELLDNAHIGSVCTLVEFAKQSCPAASLVGRASASSPLLDEPLTGSVYLRSSSHSLPDLVIDLRGRLNLVLVGRVDSFNGGLQTTFEDLPDAPVDKFVLNLAGGSKGLLINSESLCGATNKATVKARGQNGTPFNTKIKLHPVCTPKSARKQHRRAGSQRSAVR